MNSRMLLISVLFLVTLGGLFIEVPTLSSQADDHPTWCTCYTWGGTRRTPLLYVNAVFNNNPLNSDYRVKVAQQYRDWLYQTKRDEVLLPRCIWSWNEKTAHDVQDGAIKAQKEHDENTQIVFTDWMYDPNKKYD